MLVTLLEIVTEVRLLQPQKTSLPMLFTLLGMVKESRLLQNMNASPPILVTLLGMAKEVRLLHPQYLQLIVYQWFLVKTVEK